MAAAPLGRGVAILRPGRQAVDGDDARQLEAASLRPGEVSCGVPDATPYTLRHSFASLLIWEGRPITYVAAQLGHSPAMTLRTYAHVFEEFEDVDHTSAEEAIQRARGKFVPSEYLLEQRA